MAMDGNYTYCSYYFLVYTNVKSLSCTPKTDMLYANFISIKN